MRERPTAHIAMISPKLVPSTTACRNSSNFPVVERAAALRSNSSTRDWPGPSLNFNVAALSGSFDALRQRARIQEADVAPFAGGDVDEELAVCVGHGRPDGIAVVLRDGDLDVLDGLVVLRVGRALAVDERAADRRASTSTAAIRPDDCASDDVGVVLGVCANAGAARNCSTPNAVASIARTATRRFVSATLLLPSATVRVGL